MTESTRPQLRLKIPVKVNAPTPLKIEKLTPSLPKVPKPPKASKIVTPKKKLLMSQEEYKKLFDELCIKYPKVFDSNNKRVRILAIGIHRVIRNELGWSAKTTRNFFAIFCNAKKYKKTRIKGAKRYNLSGKIVGEVE